MAVEVHEDAIGKIQGLEKYLSKGSKEELNQVLAFWEKYKKEGEEMKNKFWECRTRRHNREDYESFGYVEHGKLEIENLIGQYERSKKKFLRKLSPDEKKMIESFDEITRKRFFKEYLHDRILYSWNSKKPIQREELIRYSCWSLDNWLLSVKKNIKPWAMIDLRGYDAEKIEKIAKELKDILQPWMKVDLRNVPCWLEWLEILAKEWKDSLQPWMCLLLSGNKLWAEWIEILAKEWKNSLKLWMTIVLTGNNLWAEWIKILAKEWKNSLQPWMAIYLTKNNLGNEGIKILAKERKDSLKQWMTIWLKCNNIWDEGVDAIMKEWFKMEDWVEINLLDSEDKVSDEMKQKLKIWVDSLRSLWTNFNVIF